MSLLPSCAYFLGYSEEDVFEMNKNLIRQRGAVLKEYSLEQRKYVIISQQTILGRPAILKHIIEVKTENFNGKSVRQSNAIPSYGQWLDDKKCWKGVTADELSCSEVKKNDAELYGFFTK